MRWWVPAPGDIVGLGLELEGARRVIFVGFNEKGEAVVEENGVRERWVFEATALFPREWCINSWKKKGTHE
jgi:hypothetical protein